MYRLNTEMLCNRTNNNQNCICNTSTAFTEPLAGYLTNYCQYRKGPLLKPFIWDPLPNHHFVTVKSVRHIKTTFVSVDTSWERLCIWWGLDSHEFSTTWWALVEGAWWGGNSSTWTARVALGRLGSRALSPLLVTQGASSRDRRKRASKS